MVFLSIVNFVCKNGYDRTLKVRKVLKLTGKYFGRRRNCYTIAIRGLQKALKYTTISRKVKPEYVAKLRRTRLEAACAELSTNYYTLSSNLVKCNVNLGNSVLQDLAIWEPRTFKCLTEIAQAKEKIETTTERGEYLKAPDNVITRGML